MCDLACYKFGIKDPWTWAKPTIASMSSRKPAIWTSIFRAINKRRIVEDWKAKMQHRIESLENYKIEADIEI